MLKQRRQITMPLHIQNDSRITLTYNCRLKIDEHSSWNVFPSSSFAEKSVERIVSSTNGFITWHLTIRLDAVFKTVEFPASIADLDSSLTNVD